MMGALNAFELFFVEACEDPAKEAEFYNWVRRFRFHVPAEELGSEGSHESREIRFSPESRVKLKAFKQQGVLLVPFFSALPRFETWSAPDPSGRFVILTGEQFSQVVPEGAHAILNPGSDELSKWFNLEELARLRIRAV